MLLVHSRCLSFLCCSPASINRSLCAPAPQGHCTFAPFPHPPQLFLVFHPPSSEFLSFLPNTILACSAFNQDTCQLHVQASGSSGLVLFQQINQQINLFVSEGFRRFVLLQFTWHKYIFNTVSMEVCEMEPHEPSFLHLYWNWDTHSNSNMATSRLNLTY